MGLKTVFHGSPQKSDHPSFGAELNTQINVTLGRPFFVTDNYDYAVMFARGGIISTLELDASAVIALNKGDVLAELLDIFNQDPVIVNSRGPWNEDFDGAIEESAYFLLESPQVHTHLIERGYKVVEIDEDLSLGVNSFAVLDPSCIHLKSSAPVRQRSKFRP